MNARIEWDGSGAMTLHGTLDFETVPALFRRTDEILPAGGDVVIDAASVEQSNSAGVALLLEWVRAAHERHCTLTFRNLPEQVRCVARLSGVEDLLDGEGFTLRRDAREAMRQAFL